MVVYGVMRWVPTRDWHDDAIEGLKCNRTTKATELCYISDSLRICSDGVKQEGGVWRSFDCLTLRGR